MIQSILFINQKQCFPLFLQENSRSGGGVRASQYKWCANDILKITLILKIMLLFFSVNKNFSFPSLWNILLLTFWHSSFYWLFCIPPLLAYFREAFPFPYQRGMDKGIKLWLNNWIPKALIMPSTFYKRKPIKHWHYRLKWAQLWKFFCYIKYIRVIWILDWPIKKF